MSGSKTYKSSRTLLKSAVILAQLVAVGAAALLSALPADFEQFSKAWPALLIAALLSAYKAVDNVRKNLYDTPVSWGELFRHIFGKAAVVLLVSALFLGCTAMNGGVTTHFTETITDPETGVVNKTEYMARTHAGILGKVDPTVHNWSYKWGGDENEIATGQSAEGQDNSGQALAFKTIDNLIGLVGGRVLPPAPAPTSRVEPIEMPTFEAVPKITFGK